MEQRVGGWRSAALEVAVTPGREFMKCPGSRLTFLLMRIIVSCNLPFEIPHGAVVPNGIFLRRRY